MIGRLAAVLEADQLELLPMAGREAGGRASEQRVLAELTAPPGGVRGQGGRHWPKGSLTPPRRRLSIGTEGPRRRTTEDPQRYQASRSTLEALHPGCAPGTICGDRHWRPEQSTRL